MRPLIIAALFASLLFAACAQYGQQTPATTEIPADSKIVEITSSGYNPSELTVKQGETVTWVNKNTKNHWPASAQHPTHKIYPGSGIEKCGTGEAIFDACRALSSGGTFSFTFNEKGSWNYHDHLNPGPPFFGKIVVE